MFDTVLYFLILLFLTFLFAKVKSNVLGIVLFFCYGLVAFASCVIHITPVPDLDIERITLTPYLYLVLLYVIFFAPFLYSKKDLSESKVVFKINRYYITFALLYIVASLITIKISIPVASFMIKLGDWASLYREETPVIHSNFIEYASILFTSYTRLLAFILGILMLRKMQSSLYNCIAILLILTGVITQIFSAIICTSRSMIFELFVLLPGIYLFFYQSIAKEKKRIVNILVVLFTVYVCGLFIDVTVSRFESRGIYDSLLSYLGQAPIVFNTQMFGLLDRFLYGDYTLGNLYGVKSFSPSMIGGLWDVRFYTFVGWLYVDWGGVGTILVGLLLNLLFFFFIKKKTLYVSDIFILFSYYLFLIKGVFVIGRSYIIQIIASFVIFFILKFLDYFSKGNVNE